MEKTQLKELMEQFAARLGEHCTSVQILCTFPGDGGGTNGLKTGVGDWYARQALAREFIEQNQAQTLAEEISLKQSPPDDDAEAWKNAT